MREEPKQPNYSQISDILDGVSALKTIAIREHYYCEDGWYSCPQAPEGCADDSVGMDCNCGVALHNSDVERIFAKILQGI